jgi:molybdate/tungstate transport system permease protein
MTSLKLKIKSNILLILVLLFSILIFSILVIYPLALLIVLGFPMIPKALSVVSFVQAIEVTVVMSTLSAVIAIIMGTPLAYVMARYEFRAKSVVDAVIDVPIMIPHIIVGIMVVLAFASQYGLGPILKAHGINFINTLWGATTAVAFLSSTYYIRVVETSIRMINPEMEAVARTLGAGPARVFATIILPRIWRSMATGAILSWARSVSEAGALFIVAYYVLFGKNLVYPASVYIYESYVGIGLVNAVEFSAALVAVMLVIFVIYRLLLSIGGGHGYG